MDGQTEGKRPEWVRDEGRVDTIQMVTELKCEGWIDRRVTCGGMVNSTEGQTEG